MQYHADISSSSGRHFLFKKRRETRLTTFFQVSDIYFRTYGDFHFFRFPFEKNMQSRGEQERLFGSREREGKLKITFAFYGKGTGICKLLREGKGREI